MTVAALDPNLPVMPLAEIRAALHSRILPLVDAVRSLRPFALHDPRAVIPRLDVRAFLGSLRVFGQCALNLAQAL
jgi:hypothetical protein